MLLLQTYDVTPVSYTHLDVYKRQAHEGGNIEGEMKFDQYISLVTRGVTSYVCNNNMVYA